MAIQIDPNHIAIVLIETQIPENIGSVARAMNNMGFTRLLLVHPMNCDLKRALKMATGSSIDLIEKMEVYQNLIEAIGPFQYVVGVVDQSENKSIHIKKGMSILIPAVVNKYSIIGDAVVYKAAVPI